MEQGHQAAAEHVQVPAPAMDGQAQQQLAKMRQPAQKLSAFFFTCIQSQVERCSSSLAGCHV